MLPAAIIIAGLFIGGAVFFSKSGNGVTDDNTIEPTDQISITSKDHIFGNPDAEIKLVEFADPQCHFCKTFHPTMQKIMSEYGSDGKVAWVYKHFIIFGEQSVKEATAQECAAKLGGEEKFWTYQDALFEGKDENAKLLSGTTLSGIAEQVGLNVEQFETCLNDSEFEERIETLRQEAIAVGGTGTPYTLITDKNGKILTTINGAQPFENVKAVIDQILSGETNS